jgi:hypothetical protein
MALERIADRNTLASTSDYRRIQNIKNALEQQVKNPRQIANTRLEKKSDYVSYNATEYKFYEIPGINSQISVPIAMFKMNNIIQKERGSDETQVARMEYIDGDFKLIKG